MNYKDDESTKILSEKNVENKIWKERNKVNVMATIEYLSKGICLSVINKESIKLLNQLQQLKAIIASEFEISFNYIEYIGFKNIFDILFSESHTKECKMEIVSIINIAVNKKLDCSVIFNEHIYYEKMTEILSSYSGKTSYIWLRLLLLSIKSQNENINSYIPNILELLAPIIDTKNIKIATKIIKIASQQRRLIGNQKEEITFIISVFNNENPKVAYNIIWSLIYILQDEENAESAFMIPDNFLSAILEYCKDKGELHSAVFRLVELTSEITERAPNINYETIREFVFVNKSAAYALAAASRYSEEVRQMTILIISTGGLRELPLENKGAIGELIVNTFNSNSIGFCLTIESFEDSMEETFGLLWDVLESGDFRLGTKIIEMIQEIVHVCSQNELGTIIDCLKSIIDLEEVRNIFIEDENINEIIDQLQNDYIFFGTYSF